MAVGTLFSNAIINTSAMESKKTYAKKLKDPRWQKKRLQIMDRDNYQCVCCLDNKSSLNVHHFKYNPNPWDVEDHELVTLCEKCHRVYHFIYDNKFSERIERILLLKQDYQKKSHIFEINKGFKNG